MTKTPAHVVQGFGTNPRIDPKLWVVGKTVDRHWSWEILGVFSSKEKAVAACSTARHFVGPAEIDNPMPDGKPWPGVWHPLAAKIGA